MPASYRELWTTLLDDKKTIRSSPRGMPISERIMSRSRYWVGEVVPRAKLNPALGFMEGMQLVAGTSDTSAVQRVAPKVDIGLFGPMSFYGPRVADQIPNVIGELHQDRDSRRAVLVCANNPLVDMPKGTTPCTLAIQFLIRQEKLVTLAYLRSSDIAWGIPYDVIQFSVLALAMAKTLNAIPWTIEFVGGSTHVYDNTRDLQPTEEHDSRFFGLADDFEFQTWAGIRTWAHSNVAYWNGKDLPAGLKWTPGPVGQS